MKTIEEAWVGLPTGAKTNARILALAAHDMCCQRCLDNPYWREHCIHLARIEKLGSEELTWNTAIVPQAS